MLLFTILQAQATHPIQSADDLNSTVNQLTESSIQLAEAAANFGALKVMFGVFLVFIFVIMIAFFWQLIATQKKVGDIHSSSVKIEKFFEEETNRTIGPAQAQLIIRRLFNSLAQNVKYCILRTRLENHLDQKDFITSKVTRLVTYEWGEIVSFLANFDCQKKSLADLVSEDDSKIIIDFMMEQIYLDKSIYSIPGMDQSTDLLVNSIKQNVLNSFQF